MREVGKVVEHDIQWTFTIVVKTDMATGQPTRKNMEELKTYMEVQLEHLTDEMGYSYTIEKSELKSDE
jgi:hypothetical protein